MFQIHWGGGSCICRKHLFYVFYCFFLVCQGYGQGGRMALEAGGWRLEAGACSKI